VPERFPAIVNKYRFFGHFADACSQMPPYKIVHRTIQDLKRIACFGIDCRENPRAFPDFARFNPLPESVVLTGNSKPDA